MNTSCSKTVLPLMAGVIAAFYASTAIGAGDLTRPVAHAALKKSVNYEHDKCILDESMKILVRFESDNIKLLCSVEKLEITGIAKTTQSEPIVEYNVVTVFDPANLKMLLAPLEEDLKSAQADDDLAERYMKDMQSVSGDEEKRARALLGLDGSMPSYGSGWTFRLHDAAKVVRRLANEPVAARKAQSQFRLYDDGWRVIDIKWVGYTTSARKLRKP